MHTSHAFRAGRRRQLLFQEALVIGPWFRLAVVLVVMSVVSTLTGGSISAKVVAWTPPLRSMSITRTRAKVHRSAVTSRDDDNSDDHDEFTQLSTERNEYEAKHKSTKRRRPEYMAPPSPSMDDESLDRHKSSVSLDNSTTTTTSSSAGILVPRRSTSSNTMDATATSTALDNFPSGRKLDLIWCSGTSDVCRDSIRERVVGDHNHMKFEGPATGQVAFVWDEDQQRANQHTLSGSNEQDDERGQPSPATTAVASVLILIRPNDEELMGVAAAAVRELTTAGIEVLLSPDMAAKLKHYYNVDDDMIKLFEPKGFPGFGGSHISNSDEWMRNSATEVEINLMAEKNPDLICTLGGDGLLMHASLMFPGPCPPILCVAGGSLGFLTPFSRDELVEAIQVSLGVIAHEDDGFIPLEDAGDPSAIRAYETMAQHDAYWNGGERDSSYEHPDRRDRKAFPPFKFGLGNRICLSMRMRLDCRIINREGVIRARFNVLNEVVIDRGSSPYLANLECFCDNVHLTTVQADGIIFATPTGSTAYSMAAGGSVVHPAVPAILVTPICPHVLSFRSMVFPDSVVLRCFVPNDARSSASVAFDGRFRRELNRGDSVQIQMCHYPVPTINRVDHSSDWLGSLKRSFNFNSRPRQRPL